jgi:signal transduction histidine kinase
MNDKSASAEREQTDESLRTERENVDRTVDELSGVDEAADLVISLARKRADEVLAAARVKTDERAAMPGSGAPSAGTIKTQRDAADRALRQERADADCITAAERTEHAAVLALERAETDKDLVIERARTDSALEMRDEFLTVVSHELRNQLNSMILFGRLIAEEVAHDDHVEKVIEHVRRSRRAGARMDRLIGDLVDVASIEAGRLAVHCQTVDPEPILMEALSTFQARATASQLAVSVEMARPLPRVALDPARVLQVLINLLTNAFKFTPAHGKVVVRAERTGDELRFSVSDSGKGIPADQLETVFERYVQVTKNDRRGLGLGLYISKCIVQGHGGRIWVESTLSQGSTFCFTLPLD